MKVVEKDKLVDGMLHEELERCRGMVSSLEQEISHLPKGSLHVRKKQYKKKRYRYYYLKYREGKKCVSRHVPDRQLEALKKELEKRSIYQKEIKAYKARIKYLEKILGL
jgi:hypothetical protein